ncbi:MAG: hypothetical protein P9L88_01170 [Candidatus Tantalella remota]|nr:hypothetical protein [Candidatus Tantalella remota]
MKKALTILIVFALVMSCAIAFAAEDTSTTTTGQGGFFNDAADLFRVQIADTPNQKSKTNRIFEQTPGRGNKTK